MGEQTSGAFTLTKWDAADYDTAEGATLGAVDVDKSFTGGLAGTSTARLLTAMDAAGAPAAYVGIERVTGTLDGRSGTFVLHHTAPGTAGEPIVIRIVPNTATGELAGLTGTLTITGDIERGHTYTIDYESSGTSGA